MIKYLFILFNTVCFFLFNSFFGTDPLTLTSNIPKVMKPGEEVMIELKVTKGNMGGFAKLQLDLPEGYIVKEGDSKGASFSFSDGLAKWVWSNLPTDEVMIVKCSLIAPSTPGVRTIGAKYSYVENNGKKVVEMEPIEMNVGDGIAANSDSPKDNGTPSPTSTPQTETTTPSTPTQVINPSPNSEPAGLVSGQRSISKGSSEGEYVIDIRINKGLTKGFARYSDDLSAEFSAKSIKSDGASFSVSDGKVKFVWVSVPDKEVLEISYTISGVKGESVLNGEYSYLEQNQSKTYNFSSEKITGEGIAANNSPTVVPEVPKTPTNAPESNTTVAVAPTPTQDPVNTNTVSENTNTTVANSTPTKQAEPVETLPRTEGNITYMVQIGAFTNSAVNSARLSRKFNISENIKSEMAGGFSKFMVGSHQEYKGARDHREKMRNENRVSSAFVVAYNTGKRITVQEALMISNQKWYR